MLCALTIQNFKGIGDPVRIELRPVTLLFGANNAGKSTVVHALHYLHEVLASGRTDVDRTTLGGGTVDLGGFASLVHAQDQSRTVRIRADVDLSAQSLPAAKSEYSEYDFLALDIDDEVESVWVEIEVARSELRRLSFGMNGDDNRLATIEPGPHGKPPVLVLNTDHPIVLRDDEGTCTLEVAMEEAASVQRGPDGWLVPMLPDAKALPHWGTDLFEALSEEWRAGNGPIVSALNRLIVGSLDRVRTTLEEALYIGPLRRIPPRDFRPQRTPDRGRWAEGLAGWDALSQAKNLKAANDWFLRLGLGIQAKLFERYELDEQFLLFLAAEGTQRLAFSVREIWERHAGESRGLERSVDETLEAARREQETVLERLKKTLAESREEPALRLVRENSGVGLEPADLGVGISQVVPVVMAATIGDRALAASPGGEAHRPPSVVMLEQPELHVHPALQVGLGDLFLAARKSRQFIIETHSEHLLLRIMRRIRETMGRTLPEGSPSVQPEEVSVLFVELVDEGTLIRNMPLNERGELVKAWPGGFFEEGLRESF